MVLYVNRVSVPAGTARSAAVEVDVRVEERFVSEAAVFFPAGVNGEVFVELVAGERRLFPAQEGDPAVGVGSVGPAGVRETLPGAPNVVTWRAWAPDADFPHTVVGRVEVEDPGSGAWRGRLSEFFGGGGGRVPDPG